MRNSQLIQGDWIEVLRTMPDESVHCVVTSPPYWGLRDYGTARWEGGSPECDHQIPAATLGGGTNKGHAGSFTANYKGICGACGAVRVDGQLGLERTPDEYVAKMVEGFREVRRVLRNDGTLWLNLGDAYVHGVPGGGCVFANGRTQGDRTSYESDKARGREKISTKVAGLKTKDLVGIPWLIAFALRSDGWYLRQDIIWAKPNPMPESVRDRCTKAHEYIFLLSKSERYFYDQDAVKELCLNPEDDARRISQATLDGKSTPTSERNGIRKKTAGANSRMYQDRDPQHPSERKKVKIPGGWDRGEGAHGTIHREGRTSAEYQEAEVSPYRNKRSVWGVATSPFPEAHFATFPPEIPETCIKAGCPENGTVLDPFNGAGTTGLVATRLGRNYIGIELNPEYMEMARRRIEGDAPLFNTFAEAANAD
jgi:DNA modification methylase